MHGENVYTYRDLITTRGWFCLSIRRRYSNAHNKIRGFIFSYPIRLYTSVRLIFYTCSYYYIVRSRSLRPTYVYHT